MAQPPETKLILVRHGETDANLRRCFADSDEIPLTPLGRLQAQALARRLQREFRPEILISSPFLRARQTSQIIGEILGLAAEAVAGLHERDFGTLKGHPYHRLGELCDASEPWQWTPAGGESLEDVRRRAIAALETLLARYPGKQIVIVSHGAVIQAICAHIEGHWREDSVPPNCGLVTVACHSHGWKLPLKPADWDVLTIKTDSAKGESA